MSIKHDQDKPRAGLLQDFPLALMEVAKVGTFGVSKYTEKGWLLVENGQQRYNDALWRHLLTTTEKDPESGLLHDAHVAWNALAKLELKLRNNL